MTADQFRATVENQIPPEGLSVPLLALWWDAKGEWTEAHQLVDELETAEGMAVHAYGSRSAEGIC